MKAKKWLSLLTVSLAAVSLFALSACSSDSSTDSKKSESSSALKAKSSKKKAAKKKNKENSIVKAMNQLAAESKATGEIYVTGKLEVGKKNTLKQGIYNMTVTGGSGNVMGERKSVTTGMFINWIAGVKGNDNNEPSTIRIILMEGDELELSDISKVTFTPVPEKVTPTNQLGIGNYVVGRDIKAGTYKLSTNVKLDPEYNNLGWSISTYNDDNGEERDQSLTPDSNDVAVELKDGEIITTSYDGTDEAIPADNARLIFTPVNQ